MNKYVEDLPRGEYDTIIGMIRLIEYHTHRRPDSGQGIPSTGLLQCDLYKHYSLCIFLDTEETLRSTLGQQPVLMPTPCMAEMDNDSSHF